MNPENVAPKVDTLVDALPEAPRWGAGLEQYPTFEMYRRTHATHTYCADLYHALTSL